MNFRLLPLGADRGSIRGTPPRGGRGSSGTVRLTGGRVKGVLPSPQGPKASVSPLGRVWWGGRVNSGNCCECAFTPQNVSQIAHFAGFECMDVRNGPFPASTQRGLALPISFGLECRLLGERRVEMTSLSPGFRSVSLGRRGGGTPPLRAPTVVNGD